jgi:hypothetical protein
MDGSAGTAELPAWNKTYDELRIEYRIRVGSDLFTFEDDPVRGRLLAHEEDKPGSFQRRGRGRGLGTRPDPPRWMVQRLSSGAAARQRPPWRWGARSGPSPLGCSPSQRQRQ